MMLMMSNCQKSSSRLIAICLLIFCFHIPTVFADKTPNYSYNDISEGGQLETDHNAFFLAEWWYLNGSLQLEAEDGEQRSVGWFSVVGHQESPMFNDGELQLSHLLKFGALYDEDGSYVFDYDETFIPNFMITQSIGIHKPYLMFHFPQTESVFFGSAQTGYTVNNSLGDVNYSVSFKPKVEKTLELAETPLTFTTHEYAFGEIGGSITIQGKQYFIKDGNAYFDHMIPVAGQPWPMKMHGWSWSEVTTDRYQAVVYAIRSLDDKQTDYSYKHLTIIDLKKNKVVGDFHGDDVTISESDWISEAEYGLSRPQSVTYTAGKFEVSVYSDNVAVFDRRNPNLIGFLDFMAYQTTGAVIKRNNHRYEGDAFYEYLVSDLGALQ